MKLKALLWFIARRMEAEARTNPEFIAKLHGQRFVIQFATENHRTTRFIEVRNNTIHSRMGSHRHADLTMTFANDDVGFRALTAGNQLVFMKGVQEQKIRVEGDMMLMMWFVSISKFLRPRLPLLLMRLGGIKPRVEA